MKKLKILSLLLFFISVLFFSCSKTGPQGPKGDKGESGAVGSQGTKGDKGDPGTANVIYSGWFAPSVYTLTTSFGIIHLSYNKSVPGITQAILDNGTVLTYGKLIGYNTSLWPTNQVGLLPISIDYQIGTTTNIDTWSAYATVGNLRINIESNTNAYPSDAYMNHAHSFRYIIIPGGVAGGRQSSPPPDYKDYHTVCQYYGIPE